jgi:hypothetical protein
VTRLKTPGLLVDDHTVTQHATRLVVYKMSLSSLLAECFFFHRSRRSLSVNCRPPPIACSRLVPSRNFANCAFNLRHPGPQACLILAVFAPSAPASTSIAEGLASPHPVDLSSPISLQIVEPELGSALHTQLDAQQRVSIQQNRCLTFVADLSIHLHIPNVSQR